MRLRSSVVVILLLATLQTSVHCQLSGSQPSCLGRSCYPATGNLLVGREDNLKVNSTCGLRREEQYCVVGDVSDSNKSCFTCDSRQPWSESNPNSHNVTNIVTTFSRDRLRRWWQGRNGEESVSLQLDLDAEFHFTHLIITFKTFRPKAMYIERSFDFGTTWKDYRYFAEDCNLTYPQISRGPISLDNPVICEEKYSNVLPASRGEVVFKVLSTQMDINDPYIPQVQDLLKLTNLRVVFQKLHTLGDDLLAQREEINEKYYYAIYDMVVRGSCSCYGHASRCVPSDESDWDVEDMVHSKCECTHNTKGKNCDQCADFYNDIPWTPARGKETGECRKCECHNHATKCHFDAALYHSRGNASGGVCDNCMHNTDGTNCEICKTHFYQDPTKDLRDVDICKPCDCDPMGTQNNGECDMRNDPINGLVAGKCKCKTNVGGSRCERCEVGYWDYTEYGCRECECNMLGTFGDFRCNQNTGKCNCKRFVEGQNCDQCMPKYWGLSEAIEGCRECGCDPGGSYNGLCDALTGQCDCKPGITGRACDQTIPGYFITDLDYLRYEAEYARGTGKAKVVIREDVPGMPKSWTGPGFMRVYENDELQFDIDDIPYSMHYDIIIRYETQMPYGWDSVRISIGRPESPDPDGPCGNTILEDDNPGATLTSASRHHIVRPQICLEKGKAYTITLIFPHYQVPDDTPGANILIDSIALMPFYEDIPWRFDNTPLNPGQIVFCNNLEYDVVDVDNVPEVCRKYVFSAGAAIQDKALDCGCDPTGSESSICESNGGQCTCKPNVIGRTCNQCSPGTYGFGPQGCSACNCDAQGSLDNICDMLTGYCICNSNIRGRQCNQCERGMYNFPRCEFCQCNGHADECEDKTGICINCRDNSTGDSCERCINGYYGDTSLGSSIPCEKCMCPGGEGSGFQHAETCSLDVLTKDMICDCPAEFSGDQCEECAINHYGNPLVANGTCTSCLSGCNYNIDMDVPDSCDAVTGRCTKCQYNTEGDECELCANGFHGDAILHSCVACTCNWLGADRNATEPCDRVTGQCPCLPNVIGQACDQCAPEHWKLASGEGCEKCGCDDEGSISEACNEFDGQCECIKGFGGRQCNQCESLYYGDPNVECFPCNCNIDGSKTQQCDPYTGQCPCLEGITGFMCDKCDRGTIGALPNCLPCGECFDDWDAIIKDLAELTEETLAKVNVTKSEGAVGVYDGQFSAMEEKLTTVQDIIDNLNQSEADMDSVYTSLSNIEEEIMEAREIMSNLSQNLKGTYKDLSNAEHDLSVVEQQIRQVLEEAREKKQLVDKLIQEDIVGAYNSIKENEEDSKRLLEATGQAQDLIDESLRLQNDTLELLEKSEDEFEMQNQNNTNALDTADGLIEGIRAYTLQDINKQVCDLKAPFAEGIFCDAVCGGGGCETCGEGTSCTAGAQGKVLSAKTTIEQAEYVAGNKTLDAEKASEELKSANEKAIASLAAANESNTAAKVMSEELNSARSDMTDTFNRIGKFLGEEKATPEGVILVAEEVLSLMISEEDMKAIEDLARQINETIQNLTNVDQILNETAADLAKSEKLKQRADNASKAADEILQQVMDLNTLLSMARNSQNESRIAIEKAEDDLETTKTSLDKIGIVMTSAVQKANRLREYAEDLYRRAKDLGDTITGIDQMLEMAEKLARQAEESANETATVAEAITLKYENVSDQIKDKNLAAVTANERAERLLTRAGKLATTLSTNYQSLQEMNTQLSNDSQLIINLDKQIAMLSAQVNKQLKQLEYLTNYHGKCEFTESTRL